MFELGLESFFESSFSKTPVNIAVTVNNTSRDRNGIHLVNRILADNRFNLKKIFTPEHGFMSDAPDGEAVNDSIERNSGIPIISLYGNNRKPTLEQLKEVDLLLYDIQDVGVRFYTYISTLRNVMEAANEANIEFAVLDRPDLLGGVITEGPVLNETNLSSFVGHLPVPLRYGLTPGELANWWTEKNNLSIKPHIYACKDYKCPTPFNKLNIPWVNPSPSMTSIETTKFYPGTCLFEGTNVSEGRGTTAPFQILGAPWINNNIWLKAIKELLPNNIKVDKTEFVPTFSKYANEKCFGIKLETNEEFIENSVNLGIIAIYTLMQTHPNKVVFEGRPSLKYPFIDYLSGNFYVREELSKGNLPNLNNRRFSEDLKKFTELRKKYFLYKRIYKN